jgi:hypothetical protein
MIKKHAKEMSFDDFKNAITQEMLLKLNTMNISYNRAYSIFQDILIESTVSDEDDIGSIDTIIKNIMIDYTEELLAGEFDKYHGDWE